MNLHDNKEPVTLREVAARVFRPARELMDEPLPEGVGFFHTTGSLCLFMAGVQIVTGILMAFYYVPTPELAWESVRYVNEQVPFGRVIHGLHHWGSSGFVVMIFIHMLRVFTFGAYKGKRKWTWLVGVALLLVVLGFGFTGYLLPWDMKAYFGTKVGTNIVSYTPVVGPAMKRWLLGGSEIGELTLPRFYALHALVLPALLVALTAVHLYFVRLYGITPPWKREDEAVERPETFFPAQALKDASMMLAALCVLLALAWFAGGNLEAKADPFDTAYAPHPEWYFLGLQQLLRYFEGPMLVFGAIILPGLFFLGLVLVPFLDRNPERRMTKRPFALLMAGLTVVAIVGLTYQGWRQLQFEREELARLAAMEEAGEGVESEEAVGQAVDEEAAAIREEREVAGARPGETPRLLPEERGGRTAEEVLSEAFRRGAEVREERREATAFIFNEGVARYGATLYEQLNCASCHASEEAGRGLNIPPSLAYAGDRFQPEWLVDYMMEVPPRRYVDDNRRPVERMPDYRLKESELRALVSYLTTLREPELVEEAAAIDWSAPTAEEIMLGQELYEEGTCSFCHVLNGAGGQSAPDLTGTGERLKPEFVYAIIKKPGAIIPETPMEEAFLDDDEIKAMTMYLMTQ